MITTTLIPAFIVFVLVMAGMAVGVIFAGKRITGSCGGLANLKGVDECGVCGRNLKDVEADGQCGDTVNARPNT